MDIDNIISWVSQPDVCRCCLSTSGSLDVTASYISDTGIKEVYSDMLQECFGISLSHLSEWGPSRLVCAMCVNHLRDACGFRKQVIQAEKHFEEFCSSRDFNTTDIKIEIDSEVPEGFNNDGSFSDDNEGKDTITEKENTIKSENDDRKRQKTHTKRKRKRKKADTDGNDSDTPISELKRKSLDKSSDAKENEPNDDGVRVDIPSKGPHKLQLKSVKQVSERKRVILTCGTVLKDTTACPFRHHKSWFQCFFCSQDFMDINSLRIHFLATHTDIDAELKKLKRYPRSLQIDISNLECRFCHLNLTDVESMRLHFADVHKKVIYNECIADYKVNASPYTCHICKQEFHVFRTLTTHLNEHYANCICDVCGKSFLNSKRLKVHKRTHENGQYPCSECGKILKTKTSKANHMESAHSKRQIKCQICFKPMKHYNDRIKHMSEVHNITHRFKCPICSREYNIKHYLATHIRQTHGHKNKKCSECSMAFITNHGLKKHMLKHTGEKPFTCSVCCKSYARSYTLREHMRAHENDRRYLCTE